MTDLDPLSRFALRHGTDKFGLHDYTPNYHALLKDERMAPLRVLEIGIGGFTDPNSGGESLAMWRDYLPNASILGIDIEPKTRDFGPRVTLAQGSQVDTVFLQRMIDEHGPFDLIIDDGSHQNAHVVESFEFLFPGLAAGGVYIVEDVQTAFFPGYGGSLDLTPPNSVGYFADLMAALLADEMPASEIAAMYRFHNIIALRKTGGDLTLPAAAGLARPEARYLREAFEQLDDGAFLRIDTTQDTPDWVRDRFAEVDHREIAVHFPDAHPDPIARHIRSLYAQRGAVLLEKGPNDYPSNFAFDAAHPQVQDVVDKIRAAVEQGATEHGLIYCGGLFDRAGRADDFDWAAQQLSARGVSFATGFQFLLRHAQHTGDDARFMSLLEGAHAAFPANATFAAQLASLQLGKNRVEDAAATVRHARAHGASSPQLSLRYSAILLRLGEFDAAEEEAAYGVKRKPANPSAWAALLRAQIAQGRFETAEETARRGLASCKQAPLLYAFLAECRTHLGNSDGALEAVEQGLSHDPQNVRLNRLRKDLKAA
ncbi:hypothetical protein [Tropicimonas sp. S265A]|uniref:hypothetical protein n=1 Tax=Tropicimonas sp. S265A TaxID=3415134 RepID=UPI003C79C866